MEYKENGVKFNRIDADLSDVLKDKNENKDSEENKEEIAKIEGLFKEQSIRMAEMQSRFAGMDLGMNFEEEKTLVINENSPIIKKLVSLKDDEEKKDKITLICNQIADLALLSNKELKPDELDSFVQRSNKLMSLLIEL